MTNLIYWPIVAGPVAASSSLANDPYFSSVVQLAHFDGSDGSQTFTNSCPRGTTFVRAGNNTAALTTAQKVWGTASCEFTSGAGVANIKAPSSSDYAFGTSDWTVEGWFRPTSLTRVGGALDYLDFRNTSLTAAWCPTLAADNDSGALRYIANGAVRITTGNVMQLNTWNYVAICRNSGTTRLFYGVAGGTATQQGSDFSDANTYVQNGICVGSANNNAGPFLGQVDDFRVTNGVGRYTTTFTVPAGPFPNQ